MKTHDTSLCPTHPAFTLPTGQPWPTRLNRSPLLLWLTLLLVWGGVLPALAQTPPALVWQKALGGKGQDEAYAITASPDGGYVVAGSTYSQDGDVTGNHGDIGPWVVKIDAAGGLVWQKVLVGGVNPNAITASPDGGYVVAGYTTSNDGNMSDNHRNYDYWVVKLNVSGGLVWQKALGGSGDDRAYAVTSSLDGGYVVAGFTRSNDGNVTSNHGYADFWVVKLDAVGSLVWQKTLGGSGEDQAKAVTASPDGGYVVAGWTLSNDGDVKGNHGISDYWVVKLDAVGSLVWQKALGGSDQDEANAVTASPDGGYVVAGFTRSKGGDVTGNHGDYDYWVVKLNVSGGLDWQKALGGGDEDRATAITPGPGGYVVAGFTRSKGGDVTGNHGSEDYWVVKLNAAGSLVWQRALGGSDQDEANAVAASPDGGYVVAGSTSSNDGDVTGNHGIEDYWVVKLSAEPPTVTRLSVNPNPVCAGQPLQFTATVGNVTGSYDYTLTNGAGSATQGTASGPAFSQSLTAGGSGPQTYTLTISNSGGSANANVQGTVNAPPTVSTGPDQMVYLGFGSGCTTLAASGGGMPPVPPFTYNWTSGNPADAAFSGQNPLVCPELTTTYTVKATDANGCVSAPAQVTVNVKDVRCGPGNQFVTVCYYGVTQCVSEKIAGRYLKLGATLGGCGSARMSFENEAPPLELTLLAYPNPTPDAVTVRVTAPVAGEARFEVLDVAGRARQTRTENLAQGLNEIEFRLGGLTSGVYLIRCVDALNRQASVRVGKP